MTKSQKLWIAGLAAVLLPVLGMAQTITTLVGGGQTGFSGDGGPSTQAQISKAVSVRVDANGNLYFSDYTNFRVRKIATDGTISTVAGSGTAGITIPMPNQPAVPATQAQLLLPGDLALGPDGTLYFFDGLLKIVDPSGMLTIDTMVAGAGIAVDGTGTVYFTQDGAIFRRDPGTPGTVVAGTFGQTGDDGDGGPALQAHFTALSGGLAADSSGNIYIADFVAQKVRKFTPGGNIATVAGTGMQGFSGDGGPATQAQFDNPTSVAVDAQGNLYVTDTGNNRIRKIDKNGIVTTVAGTGIYGDVGDGGDPSQAQLAGPYSVAVDQAGNIYFAEDRRIRKITPAAQ